MKSIFSFYKVFNALSLDVAAGAVICAAFFATIFKVVVLPQGLTALGLAVWIVYTADHLLDARRLHQTASTFRHQFHQRHFTTVTTLLAIAFIVELVLLFFLRKPLFYNGLWLGFGVALYVIINQWLSYVKEIAGALLYCGGILLPCISFKQESLQYADQIIVLQFLLIVFANLVLFSWMDYENDLKDHHPSLVTRVGNESAKMILWLLFCILFILNVFAVFVSIKSTFIFMAMELVLFLLFLFPVYFKTKDRFRFLGDAIFFLPVLIHIK